jgi:ribonuclease D
MVRLKVVRDPRREEVAVPQPGRYRAGALFRGDLPDDIAAQLAGGRIAWDTETSGLDWRVSRLGTCQLHSERGLSLVVQLGNHPPQNLIQLLNNPNVPKIFHHAPFDLRFMMHEWGAEPKSVLCTKVASKILAPRVPNREHSLQYLAKKYLDVDLPKGDVRVSDWRAEVLTNSQVEYALADVSYLLPLVDILLKDLDAVSLLSVYQQCCEFLPTRARLELGEFPDVFAY